MLVMPPPRFSLGSPSGFSSGLSFDCLVLCILDGWGEASSTSDAVATGNAIALAEAPTWRKLCGSRLQSIITTSGAAVGLPAGQMGNSEVGHLHIGAGRVVKQSLQRINESISPLASSSLSSDDFSGSFFTNPSLSSLATSMLQRDGSSEGDRKSVMHIMGIFSDGGVHGHEDHLLALLRFFSRAGIETRLHAFLDGRDSSPLYSREGLPRFLARCRAAHLCSSADAPIFASICGRYYAMDRDNNWDRTELAWRAIALAEGERESSPEEALVKRYSTDKTEGESSYKSSYKPSGRYSDEFVSPIVFPHHDGIFATDGIMFANFRSERMRQLASALSLSDDVFTAFDRGLYSPPSSIGSLFPYGEAFSQVMRAAFASPQIEHTFGEQLSRAGIKQLRLAETEKYAHVTYFLNGGRELPFAGEERQLVPSPKIATYDLTPAMSAHEVTDALLLALQEGKYGVIVINYANADMVGHSGKLSAAIEAIEAVDGCLSSLLDSKNCDGFNDKLVAGKDERKVVFMFFADHGNAETMRDVSTGLPHTTHTCNPVRLIVSSTPSSLLDPIDSLRASGGLIDIAPTALALLGLQPASTMTGSSLLQWRDKSG